MKHGVYRGVFGQVGCQYEIPDQAAADHIVDLHEEGAAAGLTDHEIAATVIAYLEAEARLRRAALH